MSLRWSSIQYNGYSFFDYICLFIKVYLSYYVVPISAVQYSDPVTHIYIHSFSHTLFHHTLSQKVGQSSLCWYSYKKKFEHSHSHGEDDRDSHLYISQRERLILFPSLAALRRKQLCQHLDLRFLASKTVRK